MARKSQSKNFKWPRQYAHSWPASKIPLLLETQCMQEESAEPHSREWSQSFPRVHWFHRSGPHWHSRWDTLAAGRHWHLSQPHIESHKKKALKLSHCLGNFEKFPCFCMIPSTDSFWTLFSSFSILTYRHVKGHSETLSSLTTVFKFKISVWVTLLYSF